MKRIIQFSLLSGALLLACAAAWGEETVYVKTGSAKIRAGTGLAAGDTKAVEYVRFKTKLTVLGREGDFWLHIQTPKGNKGYVDKRDTVSKEPEGRVAGEVDLSRIDVSIRTSGAMAIRGLLAKAVEAAAAKYGGRLDTAGLVWMMGFRPKMEALHAFIDEGELGRRRGGE